jgi:hypothetical protein
VKYVLAFLALLASSTSASAQDIIHTTNGIFYCHGDHPRCSWPDQSTYPYYQFSGQHLGQMSGVSDLLPDGPALPQYQTWLAELISLRPGTNAVASWSDAESKVDGGRVWGGFISARSELPDGADSQLIGLEVDVLNDGLPGVYPNASKVGLQVVGFGNANTNAMEVLTQTPSAAFQNIFNIQANSIAPDGAVIGMAPQHAGRGIDFRGSTFTDGALLLSPNQKIVFQIPGLNDAAIYRDQFSNGYLVLQAGTPGLRITNAQDTENIMIITPDGNFVTPLGSFADVLSRLSNLESKSSAGSAAVPAGAAQAQAGIPAQGALATNGGATAAATGAGAIAAGDEALASADHAVALGSSSTASAPQATAVGYGAQATGTNSVALGANSTDGGQTNVVSLGSASETRRLVNVAAGVNRNDAVNLGQLNDSLSQATASANAYTDQRVSELSYDLGNVRADLRTVRRDAEGATASSMALAGVPQTIEPGKGMVGLGVGTWQGQSAIAVGISKATDDGRFVLKAGATYNSRSQGGANAGVGWAF